MPDIFSGFPGGFIADVVGHIIGGLNQSSGSGPTYEDLGYTGPPPARMTFDTGTEYRAAYNDWISRNSGAGRPLAIPAAQSPPAIAPPSPPNVPTPTRPLTPLLPSGASPLGPGLPVESTRSLPTPLAALPTSYEWLARELEKITEGRSPADRGPRPKPGFGQEPPDKLPARLSRNLPLRAIVNWGEILAATARVGTLIGGLLYPRELGVGTLQPGDKPFTQPKLPKPSPAPKLPASSSPGSAPIDVAIKPRPKPILPGPAPELPSPAPLPAQVQLPSPVARPGSSSPVRTQPLPSAQRGAFRLPNWSTIIAAALSSSAAPRINVASIIAPQVGPTPQPQPQPQPTPRVPPIYPQAPTATDQCNCPPKKKRGPKRKCLERAKVKWAGGRYEGKLAGSKCVRFKEI